MQLEISWLGRIGYEAALAQQEEIVARKIADAGAPDELLLLEHEPIYTIGRTPDQSSLRDPSRLPHPLVQINRGGQATYHGPGQLVAYPIIHLAERGLLLRPFVRVLESAMAATAGAYGVAAGQRDGHPGCWCAVDTDEPRKIGSLGVRVESGVSYHGIALNVTTHLEDFELIDPCGMPDARMTSIAREAAWPPDRRAPTTAAVEDAGEIFARALAEAFDRSAVLEPV